MGQRSAGWLAAPAAPTHVKTFKFHDDQAKTINAAIEKAKATSGTSVNSAALEFICLDYMDGQTLQEKLAVLGPVVLAKTFTDVKNAMGQDLPTAFINALHPNVPHPI